MSRTMRMLQSGRRLRVGHRFHVIEPTGRLFVRWRVRVEFVADDDIGTRHVIWPCGQDQWRYCFTLRGAVHVLAVYERQCQHHDNLRRSVHPV